MMDGLSENDLVQIQAKLSERKRELLAEENSIRKQAVEGLSPEGIGELSKVHTHPADLGTENRQIEILGILSERITRRIQEIEDALDRIDRGQYGICELCGDTISREILVQTPERRICDECLEEHRSVGGRLEEDEDDESEEISLSRDYFEELGVSMIVSDIMVDNPIAVRMNEDVAVAINLMDENNIRHLPVIDDEGDVQGIISNRDLFNVSYGQKVRDLMSKVPETVTEDTSLLDAGTTMLDYKISCLPVVEGNRLIGIITESDFVRLVCSRHRR